MVKKIPNSEITLNQLRLSWSYLQNHKTNNMKKVILLAVFLAGFSTIAQHGERRHKDGFKNMSTEQIATLQTKKMTLALDLTDSQQDQIQSLHLEHAKLRKAKMAEHKAKKETGEKSELSSDELYAMKKARLDGAIAHKAELKNILTEKQFDKWEEMKPKKGKRHRGKHSGEKRRKKME